MKRAVGLVVLVALLASCQASAPAPIDTSVAVDGLAEQAGLDANDAGDGEPEAVLDVAANDASAEVTDVDAEVAAAPRWRQVGVAWEAAPVLKSVTLVGGRALVAGTDGTLARLDGDVLEVLHREPALGVLNGVWATETDGWAVGLDGALLRLVDGTWARPIDAPAFPTLWSVWGAGGSDVMAVGAAGTAARFDGEGWRWLADGAPDAVLDLAGDATSGAWLAVGEQGLLLASTSEPALPPSVTDVTLRGGWLGVDGAAAVVGDAGVFAVRGAGEAWTLVETGTSATLEAVTRDDSGVLWAVGDLGTVLRNDAGAVSVDAPEPPVRWRGVAATPTQVVVVGEGGDLAVRSADGWTLVAVPDGTTLNAAASDGEGGVVAVGENGLVVRWRDGGLQKLPKPATMHLNDVVVLADGQLLAVGLFGTVVLGDGATWKSLSTGSFVDFDATWGSSASDVYVAGAGGVLLHYDGQSWTEVRSEPDVDLRAVTGLDAHHVWAVGAGGRIYVFDGITWRRQHVRPQVAADGSSQPITAGLFGVFVASVDRAYAVGEQGVVLAYDGETWRLERGFEDPTLRAVWGISGDRVVAVGLNGALLERDELGWRPVESPVAVDLYGVAGAPGAPVVAVGEAGTVLVRPPLGTSAAPPLNDGTTSR